MYQRGDNVITPSGHPGKVLSVDHMYVYVEVNYGANNIRHETYKPGDLKRA